MYININNDDNDDAHVNRIYFNVNRKYIALICDAGLYAHSSSRQSELQKYIYV